MEQFEKTCRDCGKTGLTGEMFGRNTRSSDGHRHICKECYGKRIKKGWAGGTKKESMSAPSGNGNSLVIDFSRYPEVLDGLLELADVDVRTPEQQALFILKEEVPAYCGNDEAPGEEG